MAGGFLKRLGNRSDQDIEEIGEGKIGPHVNNSFGSEPGMVRSDERGRLQLL